MSRYRELLDRRAEGRGAGAEAGRGHPAHVIGWVSYGEASSQATERIGGWGGVIAPGDRWRDYVAMCGDEPAPYYEALRREVLRRRLRRGGDWHQNAPDGAPVFADGTVGLFSFRAWGDLMAAIWADADDRDYGYMDFYMDCGVPDDRA